MDEKSAVKLPLCPMCGEFWLPTSEACTLPHSKYLTKEELEIYRDYQIREAARSESGPREGKAAPTKGNP